MNSVDIYQLIIVLLCAFGMFLIGITAVDYLDENYWREKEECSENNDAISTSSEKEES